jgi:hypothetical protein
MKILKADYARYVPRERLVERVRHGTGFVSGKAQINTGGAFYLTEYKGGALVSTRSGDGILSILDIIVPIVGTVANVVAKGANFYKELRGGELVSTLSGGGIEPEALAEVLKVEDKEKASVEESSKASASETKTGQGFFYISPR